MTAETVAYEPDFSRAPETVRALVKEGDLVLTMGAGDITLPEGLTLVDDAELLVFNISFEEDSDVPEETEGEEASAESQE